jgi:tetratricopeptide (TPR) repeat protein
MSQSLPQPELQDMLAGAAQSLIARLVPHPERRAQHLGEAFLACEEAAQARPEELREALDRDALEAFLLPHVRARLGAEPGSSPRGGWLGTYVAADGRSIEKPEEDSTDPAALDTSRQALARAFSIAKRDGNDTLVRNLGWYRDRLSHKSYEAIARAEGKVPATVRTGVSRARKFLLRIVHDLQHAQPAPLDGEAPDEIEKLRKLWVDQDLETLERELERTRGHCSDDPQWLNLAALLAADRGERGEAEALYERALLLADEPAVRGRVLNNLGNLRDDQEDLKGAEHYWRRARRLVPHAPTPLLNLLAGASLRRDYASAQHYIAEISDLLNSGRLDREDRSYISRRLQENPRFAWLRDTDAWRLGPARWIRAARRVSRPVIRALAVAGAILLAGVMLLQPATAGAGILSEATTASFSAAPDAPWLSARGRKTGARGGDSMGKPRKCSFTPEPAASQLLVAGDSMGRSPSRPPRGRGRGG